MGNEHEHRIRDLETNLAAHQAQTEERFKTLFISFEKACVTMKEQTAELARLNTNMERERMSAAITASKLCANPNLCNDLRPIVERHEKILNEQKGGWKAIVTIAGFASGIAGIAGGVIGWLVSHWHKTAN